MKHKQVQICSRYGGPTSNHCSCPTCTLGVCEVCGAYEGSLTTDCPGEKMSMSRQEEVYYNGLDFTQEKGWHKRITPNQPRFE